MQTESDAYEVRPVAEEDSIAWCNRCGAEPSGEDGEHCDECVHDALVEVVREVARTLKGAPARAEVHASMYAVQTGRDEKAQYFSETLSAVVAQAGKRLLRAVGDE
jgi:hypothetical protein